MEEKKENEMTVSETEENKENTEPAAEEIKPMAPQEPEQSEPAAEEVKPENGPAPQPDEEVREETVRKEKSEQKEEVKAEPAKPAKKAKKPVSPKLKTCAKVLGVIAVVFAAAFAGTFAAVDILQERIMEEIEDAMSEYMNPFSGFDIYDYGNYGNGGSSSSSKTNNNSAGLGVYIYSDSDVAQIAAFTDDSLADDAGLQVGDIIVSVNGEETDDYDDVVEILADFEPGDTVTIGYERDGEHSEVEVELIDRNASSASDDSDFPTNRGNQYMQ